MIQLYVVAKVTLLLLCVYTVSSVMAFSFSLWLYVIAFFIFVLHFLL